MCRPARSQGSSTPEPLRGHGPSFPRVDPAPGPLPTSEGPSLPPHLRGWWWPSRRGAQALLLSLCLPGSSHIADTAPLLPEVFKHANWGFRRRFTPARCALVFPGARRLAQNVQDRSAGRDFLDGGRTAGGSVMPPVLVQKAECGPWASCLSCDPGEAASAGASFLLLKLLCDLSYPGQRGEAGVSCWTPDSPTASLHSLGSITTLLDSVS